MPAGIAPSIPRRAAGSVLELYKKTQRANVALTKVDLQSHLAESGRCGLLVHMFGFTIV